MEARKQFTFYESIRASIKRIKKAADRCAAYDAICDYALYGVDPDLDQLPESVAILLESVKPNLDASRRKAESGKSGGSAVKTGKQTESKPEANGKQTGREKEKEKEKEIENEIENETEGKAVTSENLSSVCDDKTIIRAWNDMGIAKIDQVLNPTGYQRDALRGAIREFGVERILEGIRKVQDSAFLCGDKTGFKVTFLWFLKSDNLRKVLDGNYDDRKDDVPKGASGELGEAELEAIRRTLAGPLIGEVRNDV